MKNTDSEEPRILIFLATCFAITFIWALSGFILFNSENRGTFGDMFGAINALFSGLAFAGVIYAILLQKRELQLQRKELELTREELRRSASAQEQSEIALREQAIALENAAKINALNSLISGALSRASQITATVGVGLKEKQELTSKALSYMEELERILKMKI